MGRRSSLTFHSRYTVVPHLTSVDHEAHALGAQAARLLECLADPQRPLAQVVMPARLVVR